MWDGGYQMDEAAAEVIVAEERVEEELHQSALSPVLKDAVYRQVLKSRCLQRRERRSAVEAPTKRQ